MANMCFPKMSYMNSHITLSKNKPWLKLSITIYGWIILNIITNMYM
jgi:hypothetical protein